MPSRSPISNSFASRSFAATTTPAATAARQLRTPRSSSIMSTRDARRQTVAQNLVTACQDCNQGKATTLPDAAQLADLEADTVRWARAMRTAASIQFQQRSDASSTSRVRRPLDRLALRGEQDGRPGRRTGETALAAGSTSGWRWKARLSDRQGHEQAVRRQETWRYFCGVCWGILRERADMAKEIVETQRDEAF